jgi:ABC-type transport system involved in multi-copper enzyme maturation permease subunit
MKLNCWPIVEREMRVNARHPNTYRNRMGAATMALALGAGSYWVMSQIDPGLLKGPQGFMFLTSLVFLFCIGKGAALTADCVSEEKRGGTLGLLFLTDLKGADVVVGKLLANGLQLLGIVLAMVPILAITLLLGGVKWSEFFRVVLNLFNTMFFSLAMGLLISTLSENQRKANNASVVILLIFLCGFPGLAEWLRRSGYPDWADILRVLSPAYAHVMAFDQFYGLRSSHFWPSLFAIHGLAWAFLSAAALLVPHCWQDRPAPVRIPWKDRVRQWMLGSLEARELFRKQLLGNNPFYWLAARDRFSPTGTWLIMLLIPVGGSILVNLFDAPIAPVCVMSGLGAWFTLKLSVLTTACQRIAEDKQNGTLEVVLGTSLESTEIIRGHWLALRHKFSLMIAVVLIGTLALFSLAFSDAQLSKDDRQVMRWTIGSYAIISLLDLLALGWAGFFAALEKKNLNLAASAAALRVLILPWVLFLIGLAIFTWIRHYEIQISSWWLAGAFFAPAILVPIFWCFQAQHKLPRELRTMAFAVTSEPENKFQFLLRLFRRLTRSAAAKS